MGGRIQHGILLKQARVDPSPLSLPVRLLVLVRLRVLRVLRVLLLLPLRRPHLPMGGVAL